MTVRYRRLLHLAGLLQGLGFLGLAVRVLHFRARRIARRPED
jgi:hypothetical protein